MNRCNSTNQYYDDIIDPEGNIEESKCFDSNSVYGMMKNFKFNNFKEYNNREYYNYLNKNFGKYSFPENYLDLNFENICKSESFSLKPQQKFVSRIFNTNVDNNGLLIFHGLGSGKTATSIIVGEAFKFRKTDDSIIRGRSDHRVLIVVPANLTNQYFKEIVGSIEDGKIKAASGEVVIEGDRQYYLDKGIRRALDVISKNIIRLTNEIESLKESGGNTSPKEYQLIELTKQAQFLKDKENENVTRVYEILSHEKFLNRLFSSDSSTFVDGDYLKKLQVKNGLLIIDEAHRLVSATGTSYRKLLLAMKYSASPDFKIILLSGSPIYDKPFEFGLMINLLRPRIPFPDGQDAFNDLFLLNNQMINKRLFKMMTTGYVSYFKGGNPEAYPYKKTIIMNHSMNPYQYSVYKKALIKEIEKDREKSLGDESLPDDFLVKMISSESDNDQVSTSVFNNSRLFCNIAFPEILTKDQSRESVATRGLNEFKKILSIRGKESNDNSGVLSVVKEHSAKFAKVAELIELSPGPVFIYSNYVTYGVDAMAAVLYALGYREYSTKRPNPEYKTYFVWKGDSDQKVIPRAKDSFDSIENIDGKRIKVLLGTQSVMEGVDFKRVRQVHVLDPWWNDSRMQQVIARAIRLCSHTGLPEEKRLTDVFIHLSTLGESNDLLYSVKFYGPNGVPTKGYSRLENKYPNPDAAPENWYYIQAFITERAGSIQIIEKKTSIIKAVDIISVSPIKDLELSKKFQDWKQLSSYSVEEYMYKVATKKLHLNRQFEMSIKEVALDCNINKYGNIVRLDEKYIPYSKKEYCYELQYENYQTGKRYSRIGVKSLFDDKLPEGVLVLRDVLENTARNSGLYKFKEIDTGITTRMPTSLIVPEDIKCESLNYSFSELPRQVVNLTINKELSKYLMKMDIELIKKFLRDVETGKISGIFDAGLPKKIQRFYSKEAISEKQQIIIKLKEFNIGDSDVPWELETTENLKKLYKQLTGKK